LADPTTPDHRWYLSTDGIGGVVGLMQNAVAPQLLGDQADLVEGGTLPAL
jgi:hypothetical protein